MYDIFYNKILYTAIFLISIDLFFNRESCYNLNIRGDCNGI